MESEKLGEMASVTAGTSPKGELINSQGLGFPFFQGTKDFGDLFPTAERYTEHPVRVASKGEILIGVRAPVGEVNFAIEDSAIGRGVMAVNAKNPEHLNFLFYFLKSLQGKWDSLGSTGSVFENLSASTLREVSVPGGLHKKEIGEVLLNLDLKIQSNKSLSNILLGIAQALFKSWFIDFDPVKAKMAGEKPVGMEDDIASLFPNAMETFEGEEIPLGWRKGVVSDVCESVVNGSTPLRNNSEFWNQSDLAWFKTGELSDNFLFESKEAITFLALKKTSVKKLPKGSVLMAIYAAPTVGRLGILTKESTFNQACTGMVPKTEFGTAYVFLTLFNRRVWFNSLAIGAAQQNISKAVVENCPAIIANTAVLNAFRQVTDPIFAQMETLSSQNITLEKIRDSLSPRLISGDLQIPEEMLAH